MDRPFSHLTPEAVLRRPLAAYGNLKRRHYAEMRSLFTPRLALLDGNGTIAGNCDPVDRIFRHAIGQRHVMRAPMRETTQGELSEG